MMKAALLAAAVLIVGASAANAKTLKYTFGTSTGGSYCDGVTLKTTDNVIYGGHHTGSCTKNDKAGGFAATISGTSVIDIATTDKANAPGKTFTFLLNTKAATWALYTLEGSTYTLINQGPLVAGAPPAMLGAKPSVLGRK